jgi:hypothetical protein
MKLAVTQLDPIAAQLERASADWSDGDDLVLPTGLTYGAGAPVEVTVRKRGWRHDISDGGSAIEAAGRPPGWQAVAERVVEDHAINVNRRGVVFVQSNEARLAPLVVRVAECSLALYEALLEHE